MKIILTENQLRNILLTEQINKLLITSLNEGKNLNSIKKNIKKMLLAGISAASIISCINSLQISGNEKYELIKKVKLEDILNQEKETNSLNNNNTINNDKVEACKKYMEIALRNQGYTFNDTKLKAEALVNAAENYSFDLPLLLAAAHLESCFGATNRAKRTNSVYSVGAYDNGKDVVTYSHPNESIAGYIKLLKNDYLINGKTIDDLLKPNSFVNKNGHRYASKKTYENELSSIRNKIIKNFPELI